MNKSIALIGLLVAVIIGVIFLLGSSSSGDSDSSVIATDINTIIVGGSGSGMGPLKAAAEVFEEKHPLYNVTFKVSSGSGGGIQSVYVDALDIGAVARPPKKTEPPVTFYPVAQDAIAFVVAEDVGELSVTSEPIKEIYEGRVRNWQAVGGPDLPIRVLGRTESETPTVTIRKHNEVFADMVFSEEVLIASNATEMAEGLVTYPGAIGYTGLGIMSLQEGVWNVVDIDGVELSGSSVADGSYPYVMNLGLVINGDPAHDVSLFLDHLTSEVGKKSITGAGYFIPDNHER